VGLRRSIALLLISAAIAFAQVSRSYAIASDYVRQNRLDIAIPMLEMYTTGVTLTTSRVSARAVMPAVLALIASGRLHPELVTSRVVAWAEAADALAEHTHKTVVVRPEP